MYRSLNVRLFPYLDKTVDFFTVKPIKLWKKKRIVCIPRDCKGKLKGGIGWNLRISGVDWATHKSSIWCFCLREIDIKLCQNYAKTYVRFCIWFIVLNRSYLTNTQPIWKQGYPRGAGETKVPLSSFLKLELRNWSLFRNIKLRYKSLLKLSFLFL